MIFGEVTWWDQHTLMSPRFIIHGAPIVDDVGVQVSVEKRLYHLLQSPVSQIAYVCLSMKVAVEVNVNAIFSKKQPWRLMTSTWLSRQATISGVMDRGPHARATAARWKHAPSCRGVKDSSSPTFGSTSMDLARSNSTTAPWPLLAATGTFEFQYPLPRAIQHSAWSTAT